MNDLTPETLAELRRLVDAVPMPGGDDPDIIGRWWDAGDLQLYPVEHPRDREFIQAFSPDVVRELLDAATELAHMTEARDNARARVVELEAAIERVRELAEHYAGLTNVDAGGAILRALDGTQP